jgi:hypothetical protein
VSTYPPLFVLSTGLLTATTQACLPIPFTFKEAPPVVGHYRDQSGAPLVGAEVSVTAYGKTDCSKPTYLVRTDSTGAVAQAMSDPPMCSTSQSAYGGRPKCHR